MVGKSEDIFTSSEDQPVVYVRPGVDTPVSAKA